MNQTDIFELFKVMENYYSAESWKKFYKPKLERFFLQYEKGAPIESITAYHVKVFLDAFGQASPRKLNYYNALSSFYSIAYEHAGIKNIMIDIERPIIVRKPPEYVSDEHIEKIREFIDNPSNKINDRLLLGIVFYTGLSRRYIFDLEESNIKYGEIEPGGESVFSAWIIDDSGEHRIPITKKLDRIIRAYKSNVQGSSPHLKLFNYSQDTTVSARVSTLTKRITGKSYSMNIIGNTFIKLALKKNPDVYAISRITLKSVVTIEKHLTQIIDEELFKKQLAIVDSL